MGGCRIFSLVYEGCLHSGSTLGAPMFELSVEGGFERSTSPWSLPQLFRGGHCTAIAGYREGYIVQYEI